MSEKKCINCANARRASSEDYRDELVGCANSRNELNENRYVVTEKNMYQGWADHVWPDSKERSRAMSNILLVPVDAYCKYFDDRKQQ